MKKMFFPSIKNHYKEVLILSFAPLLLLFRWRRINEQDFFSLLRPLRLLILVVVVGLFAFVFVPQGQHAMMTLRNLNGNFYQILATVLSSMYWSFQLYYGSKMLLKLARIRHDMGKEVRLYIYMHNMPIIFGSLPYLIVLTGLICANGLRTKTDWLLAITLIVFNVGTTTFHYSQMIAEKLYGRRRNWKSVYLRTAIREELNNKDFSPVLRRRFYGLIATFALVFSVFTYLSIYGIAILQLMGPAAILITGLSAWVAIATVLAVVNNHIFRFAGIFVVFLFVLSSYFNDNHNINTLDEPISETRPDVLTHFENWKKARQKGLSKQKTYPVFIVAVEGGGSRSAYWSGSLLSAFCDTLPDLGDHFFALSGVSGGSLGSSVFTLIRRMEVMKEGEMSKLAYTQNILKKDFLSPLTASLIFPDFSQRFIPFKIPIFDRAKALERTWQDAFKRAMHNGHTESPFEISLKHFWADDTTYRVPSLFLNCTVVNSGKRAVISNLRLNATDFDDVVALNDTIGKSISLSTAVSLSSRFPYITPSGSIQKPNGKHWGSIVDGGYFDNSGILTALEIMAIIKKSNDKSKDKIVFEPYLIIISNYMEYFDGGLYNELNEPIKTVINRTFGGSIGYARARVKKEIKPDHIIELSLNATQQEVPLGWYLSKSALNVMDYRLNVALNANYSLFNRLIHSK